MSYKPKTGLQDYILLVWFWFCDKIKVSDHTRLPVHYKHIDLVATYSIDKVYSDDC